MSATGHATIVLDERGVKVQRETNNTSFCFDYGIPILPRINTTLQWPLCVALVFLQMSLKGTFCSGLMLEKLPWKVLYRQSR